MAPKAKEAPKAKAAPKAAAPKADSKAKAKPKKKEEVNPEDKIPKVEQPDRAAMDEAMKKVNNEVEGLQKKLTDLTKRIQGRSTGKEEFFQKKQELRAKLLEESRKREMIEHSMKTQFAEIQQSLANAAKAAQERADDQGQQMFAKLTSLEVRLAGRMDEGAERSLKEMRLGDQDVLCTLRPEIQSVNQLVLSRSQEVQEHADSIVRNAIATMRNEMDSVSKRMASNSERLVEQKARDVLAKVTEEVDASNRRCDTVKEGASVALHEATTILRKSVTDVRASVGAEVQSLGQLIQGIEERIGQATVEAEKRALEAARARSLRVLPIGLFMLLLQ